MIGTQENEIYELVEGSLGVPVLVVTSHRMLQLWALAVHPIHPEGIYMGGGEGGGSKEGGKGGGGNKEEGRGAGMTLYI